MIELLVKRGSFRSRCLFKFGHKLHNDFNFRILLLCICLKKKH